MWINNQSRKQKANTSSKSSCSKLWPPRSKQRTGLISKRNKLLNYNRLSRIKYIDCNMLGVGTKLSKASDGERKLKWFLTALSLHGELDKRWIAWDKRFKCLSMQQMLLLNSDTKNSSTVCFVKFWQKNSISSVTLGDSSECSKPHKTFSANSLVLVVRVSSKVHLKLRKRWVLWKLWLRVTTCSLETVLERWHKPNCLKNLKTARHQLLNCHLWRRSKTNTALYLLPDARNRQSQSQL